MSGVEPVHVISNDSPSFNTISSWFGEMIGLLLSDTEKYEIARAIKIWFKLLEFIIEIMSFIIII